MAKKDYTYVPKGDIETVDVEVNGQSMKLSKDRVLSGLYMSGQLTNSEPKTTAPSQKSKFSDAELEAIKKTIISNTRKQFEIDKQKEYTNLKTFQKKKTEDLIPLESLAKLADYGFTKEMIISFFNGVATGVPKLGISFDYDNFLSYKSYEWGDFKGIMNDKIESVKDVLTISFKYPNFTFFERVLGKPTGQTTYLEENKVLGISTTYNVFSFNVNGVDFIIAGDPKGNPSVKGLMSSSYLAFVSHDKEGLFNVIKELLYQEGSDYKDLAFGENGLFEVPQETLKKLNQGDVVKFGMGGQVIYRKPVEKISGLNEFQLVSTSTMDGSPLYEICCMRPSGKKDTINLWRDYSLANKYFHKFVDGFSKQFEKGGSMENTIPEVILMQLGGQRKLSMFTGAYNFGTTGDNLMFKIKNRKVNYVKISLNSDDLYDLEFGKIHGTNYKIVSEFNNIYFDQLIPIFERETGMYLSFRDGGMINAEDVEKVNSMTPLGRAMDYLEDEFEEEYIEKAGYGKLIAMAGKQAGEKIRNSERVQNFKQGNREWAKRMSETGYEDFYKDGGVIDTKSVVMYRDGRGNPKTGKVIEVKPDGSFVVASGLSMTLIEPHQVEESRKASFWDFFEKGGNLSDAKYIPPYEVFSFKLKNGKVFTNGGDMLSGLHVSEQKVNSEEVDPNQLSLFAKGGNLPANSVYFPKRDIESVVVGDGWDESTAKNISGEYLMNGIWWDRSSEVSLWNKAVDEGLLSKKQKIK